MFKTLDDLKRESKDSKDKKDKKTTNSYAGGEKSGLAIENPEDINGIIDKAEKSSKNPKEKGEKPETNCKITLFQNGFRVDDGEFRNYTDDQNKQFMAELNKGYVPKELREKYPKGLSVGLEDRRQEMYELPPPPKYIAFSGQGTALGNVKTNEPILLEQPTGKVEPPKVDKSKPTTTISLRLANGKVHELVVNVTTRLSEIAAFAFSACPLDGGFDLIAGFPPKPIKNMNETIEDAGLEDSKITQKAN